MVTHPSSTKCTNRKEKETETIGERQRMGNAKYNENGQSRMNKRSGM
jgi:hypothetical protein